MKRLHAEWMLSVDLDAEACLSPGRKTCCSGAAERRLHQVAVEQAYDIVASATSSLRTLVADNAVLYRRKSQQFREVPRNRCYTVPI